MFQLVLLLQSSESAVVSKSFPFNLSKVGVIGSQNSSVNMHEYY